MRHLLTFLIIAISHQSLAKDSNTSFDKKYSAAGACMIFIKRQLHDPDSADFDSTKDAYVAEKKDSFIVQRHIRAKNGFGAKVAKVMECKLIYKEGTWYPVYVKEIK